MFRSDSEKSKKKKSGKCLYLFAPLFCWLQNVCVGIPGERAPYHTKCQSSGVLQRRSSSAVGDVTVPPPTTTTSPPIKSPWMDEYFMSGHHTSPSETKQSGKETDLKCTRFLKAHSSRQFLNAHSSGQFLNARSSGQFLTAHSSGQHKVQELCTVRITWFHFQRCHKDRMF